MKQNKIKSLILRGFLSAVTMLAISLFSTSAPAQIGKTGKIKQDVEVVKLPARKGKGKDKNASRKKPKPKSRNIGATVCNIEIKNNTKHLVYVYVNGYDRGSIGVGDTFKSIEETGRIKVYTRTDRLKYDFLYWGPNYFTCGNNQQDGKISLETNDVPKPR